MSMAHGKYALSLKWKVLQKWKFKLSRIAALFYCTIFRTRRATDTQRWNDYSARLDGFSRIFGFFSRANLRDSTTARSDNTIYALYYTWHSVVYTRDSARSSRGSVRRDVIGLPSRDGGTGLRGGGITNESSLPPKSECAQRTKLNRRRRRRGERARACVGRSAGRRSGGNQYRPVAWHIVYMCATHTHTHTRVVYFYGQWPCVYTRIHLYSTHTRARS